MLRSLFRLLNRSASLSRPVPSKIPYVPNLEALEERWMPSATPGLGSINSLLYNATATTNSPTTNSTTTDAASQTQQVTASFAAFKTGGTESQTIAQFNPALGTLNSVQIQFNGTMTSDVKVENLDSSPSSVNAQVNGNLTLQGPDGSNLTSVTPTISENTSLSAYDGTLDFGGTSGHDFGSQSASSQQTVTLTNNLSAWQGSGNVTLTETAQSSSTVSGSGNQQVQIATQGAGAITLIYNYTPATTPTTTPPPSTPPPTTTCAPPSGPATITGIVYDDPSNTGQYQTSDTGVGNVTVTLSGITLTQQMVSETTTTSTNGTYSFTNLQPGIYSLSDQPIPSQYTAGAATVGSLGGTVSNGQLILALPQGGDAMCYDFGLVPVSAPSSGGGTVAPTSGTTTTPSSSTPADPATPTDPSAGLSKRSLLGDGWQSLG
jgi:hypothetical protein